MVETQLLRLEDVATRLGVSYMYCRKLILHDEVIPHVKIAKRGIRVKEEDLEKYIAGLERKGQSVKQEAIKDTREPYLGRGELTQIRNKPPKIKGS